MNVEAFGIEKNADHGSSSGLCGACLPGTEIPLSEVTPDNRESVKGPTHQRLLYLVRNIHIYYPEVD